MFSRSGIKAGEMKVSNTFEFVFDARMCEKAATPASAPRTCVRVSPPRRRRRPRWQTWRWAGWRRGSTAGGAACSRACRRRAPRRGGGGRASRCWSASPCSAGSPRLQTCSDTTLLVCNFPPGGLYLYLMIYFIATSKVSARMSTIIVDDRYQHKNSIMNKTTTNCINATESFSHASFI